MQQQGRSPIRSDDGRWEWDGQQWRPAPEPAAAEPPPPAPAAPAPPAPPPPPVAEGQVPVGTWGATPAAADLPTYTGYMDYAAPQARGGGAAIASLVLGILALIAWLFPLAGLPVAVAGLVCGILGRRSTRRGMAVAGLVMSAVGLVLAIGNAILGVIIRLSGGA